MTTQNHTTPPSPETLLAIARHLTEDGDGIEQSLCDEVAAWLKKVAAQPQQPAGWKLVPVEPTPEMLEAGRDAGDFHIMHYDGADKPGTPRYSLGRSYAAMLDAAPAHPSQQEDDARDAARYRWLRGHFRFAADSECEIWFDGSLKHSPADQLDAAIDAAIAAQDPQQGEA